MEELYKQQWEALAELLGGLHEQRVGLAEGCRTVVARYYRLEPSNPLFDPFRDFDSESDDFPIGDVRELWAADSLNKMDEHREATEVRHRDWVFDATTRLRAYAREKSVLGPRSRALLERHPFRLAVKPNRRILPTDSRQIIADSGGIPVFGLSGTRTRANFQLASGSSEDNRAHTCF